jgi:hypothetical protein
VFWDNFEFIFCTVLELDHYSHKKRFLYQKLRKKIIGNFKLHKKKNTPSERISTHYRYLTNRTKKFSRKKGAQYRDAMRRVRDSSLSANEIGNRFF